MGSIKTRPDNAIGNQGNLSYKILQLIDIISRPVEIIALNATPSTGGAYAGKRQAGAVGDVLEIQNITDANENV